MLVKIAYLGFREGRRHAFELLRENSKGVPPPFSESKICYLYQHFLASWRSVSRAPFSIRRKVRQFYAMRSLRAGVRTDSHVCGDRAADHARGNRTSTQPALCADLLLRRGSQYFVLGTMRQRGARRGTIIHCCM